MRKGRKQKVDWREREAPKFTIQPPTETIECGAWALHTITKVPYHLVVSLSKGGHWSTKTMLNFLKKCGCDIKPITLGNIVEGSSVKGGKKLLSSQNVILIEQGCFEEESTWAVLFDNKISHSGDVSPISPMEFINWPILQAYSITHEKWIDKEAKEKEKEKKDKLFGIIDRAHEALEETRRRENRLKEGHRNPYKI